MVAQEPISFWHVVQRTNPPVASDWSIPAPGRGIWRVMAVRFTLVTDINVANRTVALVLDDGTNEFLRVAYEGNIVAASTTQLGAYPGANRDPVTLSTLNVALPTDGALLRPGWRLRSVSAALQAGDQYSAITILVQEFPTGPAFEWVPTVDTLINPLE